MDLNLDGLPVINEDDMRLAAVRQNVYPFKGKRLAVHGKTATALRIVPLPELVQSVARATSRRREPGMTVFVAAGPDGQSTYWWLSNVRRSVRAVCEQVGLGWMTPHTWRHTDATILDDEMSLTPAKADLMGQASLQRHLRQPWRAASRLVTISSQDHADLSAILDTGLDIVCRSTSRPIHRHSWSRCRSAT